MYICTSNIIAIMKGEHLGELEELVLLAIGGLGEQAYAVAILDEIMSHAKRSMDVTAVHSVLRRLEKKGFVKSKMGGASNDRGGRRKRFFSLTPAGRSTLDAGMEVRLRLYKKLLQVNLQS